jgi:transcriptional regulator of arginine metabolism
MAVNENSGAARRRREAIRRLLRERAVRSQTELGRILRAEGLDAAQPTLSRDIHELGLVKGPNGYMLPEAAAAPATSAAEPSVPGRREEGVRRLIRQYVLSVDVAASLVVLRTPPADAQPVALAIDAASLEGVVGTLAGDDTIFLATRSDAQARELARRLAESIRPSGASRPARFAPRRRPAAGRRRA